MLIFSLYAIFIAPFYGPDRLRPQRNTERHRNCRAWKHVELELRRDGVTLMSRKPHNDLSRRERQNHRHSYRRTGHGGRGATGLPAPRVTRLFERCLRILEEKWHVRQRADGPTLCVRADGGPRNAQRSGPRHHMLRPSSRLRRKVHPALLDESSTKLSDAELDGSPG